MNKHIVKPTVSVLFAAFALIASIIALLAMNGSVAWFNQNNQVSAGGLSVSLRGDGSGLTALYSYGVTSISTTYGYEEVELSQIPRFDPEQIDDSHYKPALLICLEYSFESDKTYSLTATCPSSSAASILATQNYMSNAVQFRLVNSVAGGVATPAASDPLAFVDPIYSGASVSGATQARTSIPLSNGISGEGTLYFIMEYNSPVVKYICDQRSSDNELNEAVYQPDITLVITEVVDS